jgi:hypothetical protein
MKKTLLTLGLLATILSCSTEENEVQQTCSCTQETYERVTNIVQDELGLIHQVNYWVLRNEIEVVCQDETDGKEPIGNGLWIEIKCN